MTFEMAPNNLDFDFEQISFKPFESPDGKIFQDDRDPDLNYFDEINIPSKEKTYLNDTDIKNFLYETQRFGNFSVLHVNIRGLKTNSENFRNLLNNTRTSFNIICLTETWCSNCEIINSSYFDISNYKAIPFERKRNKKGGSILIFLKTDLMYKITKDLPISDKDKEILTIETTSKESKNMLISCCYRPPKGVTENLTAYLASIFQGVQNEKKKIFIIGDFNLNCLNYNEDSNIRLFHHKVFELEFIPLIDKPTRVCKNRRTIIDNILTNCVFGNTLKKAIIKIRHGKTLHIRTLTKSNKIKSVLK